MNEHPPHDKTEFAIRFGCAFFFFGGIVALMLLRVIDELGIVLTIGAWVTITLVISFAAGRLGDPLWKTLIQWLQIW